MQFHYTPPLYVIMSWYIGVVEILLSVEYETSPQEVYRCWLYQGECREFFF
jgi:hypothetical protein